MTKMLESESRREAAPPPPASRTFVACVAIVAGWLVAANVWAIARAF